MKGFGVALIIIGILMFVFSGFTYKTEKHVADVGPIEINKTEHHSVGWPVYAGGLTLLAGIVMLVAGGKKIS